MLGKRAVPPDVDVSMTMVNTSAVVPPSPGGTASRTPSPSLGNLFRPNNWFRRQRTTSSSKATTLQLPELQHGSNNSLSSRMPRISEPKNPRPLPPSASRSVLELVQPVADGQGDLRAMSKKQWSRSYDDLSRMVPHPEVPDPNQRARIDAYRAAQSPEAVAFPSSGSSLPLPLDPNAKRPRSRSFHAPKQPAPASPITPTSPRMPVHPSASMGPVPMRPSQPLPPVNTRPPIHKPSFPPLVSPRRHNNNNSNNNAAGFGFGATSPGAESPVSPPVDPRRTSQIIHVAGFLNKHPSVTSAGSAPPSQNALAKGWKPYKVVVKGPKLLCYKPPTDRATAVKDLFPVGTVNAIEEGDEDAEEEEEHKESPVESRTRARRAYWGTAKHPELVLGEDGTVHSGTLEALVHECIYATATGDDHHWRAFSSAVLLCLPRIAGKDKFEVEFMRYAGRMLPTNAERVAWLVATYLRHSFVPSEPDQGADLARWRGWCAQPDVGLLNGEHPTLDSWFAASELPGIILNEPSPTHQTFNANPVPSGTRRHILISQDALASLRTQVMSREALFAIPVPALAESLRVYFEGSLSTAMKGSPADWIDATPPSPPRIRSHALLDAVRMRDFSGSDNTPHWLSHLILNQLLLSQPTRRHNPNEAPIREVSRAQVLVHWVKVGEHAHQTGDWTTWRSIAAALCARPVARLDKLWRRIEGPHRGVVQSWSTILMAEIGGNTTVSRSFSSLANSKVSPRLPWLGDLPEQARNILQSAGTGGAAKGDEWEVEMLQQVNELVTQSTKRLAMLEPYAPREPLAEQLDDGDLSILVQFWNSVGHPERPTRDMRSWMEVSMISEGRLRGRYVSHFWTTLGPVPAHNVIPTLFVEALPTISFMDRGALLRTKKESLESEAVRPAFYERSIAGVTRSGRPSIAASSLSAMKALTMFDGELTLLVQPGELASENGSGGLERKMSVNHGIRVSPAGPTLERKSSAARRSSLPILNNTRKRTGSASTPNVESTEAPLSAIVRAGTLERLVDVLVHGLQGITVGAADDNGEMSLREGGARPLKVDQSEFNRVWWYTFRSFVTPIGFFELLRKRYLMSMMAQRVEVLQVVEEWLAHGCAAQDALDNPDLYDGLKNFLTAPSLRSARASGFNPAQSDGADVEGLERRRKKCLDLFLRYTLRPRLHTFVHAKQTTVYDVPTSFRIDEMEPWDLVNSMDATVTSLMRTIQPDDFFLFADCLEALATDSTAWYNLPDAIAENGEIQTIYSLIQDLPLPDSLWNPDGPRHQTLLTLLPATMRGLFNAYNALHKWLLWQIAAPTLGLQKRERRMNYFLAAIEICRARSVTQPDGVSEGYNPYTQPCPRSMVETLLTNVVLSGSSRCYHRAWAHVAASRNVTADSLTSLLARSGVPHFKGPRGKLCPDFGWAVERVIEILCMEDTVANAGPFATSTLVNMEKRRSLADFVTFILSEVKTRPPDVEDEDIARINALREEVRFADLQQATLLEAAHVEAAQGGRSGRRIAVPFQAMVFAQQEKNKRDRHLRHHLVKVKRAEHARAQQRDEDISRAMISGRRTNGTAQPPSAKHQRGKKSMSALYKLMRPLSTAFSTDNLFDGGRTSRHKPADLDFEPTGAPAFVISLVDARVSAFVNNQRSFVFHLDTEDGGRYLFQAMSKLDMNKWIAMINKVAQTTQRKRLTFLGTTPNPAAAPGNSQSANPRDPVRVFGVELSYLIERETGSPDPPAGAVPQILNMLLEEIETRGLTEEGIYRIAGVKSTNDAIKQVFNSGRPVDMSSDLFADIFSLCDTVKAWFRELPGGLIPADMYGQAVQATQHQDFESRLDAARELVHGLPTSHFAVLHRIIQHLHEVTSQEEHNHMSPMNLAIVFSGNLFHSPDGVASFANMGYTHQLTRLLILNFVNIFSQPPAGPGDADADHDADEEVQDEDGDGDDDGDGANDDAHDDDAPDNVMHDAIEEEDELEPASRSGRTPVSSPGSDVGRDRAASIPRSYFPDMPLHVDTPPRIVSPPAAMTDSDHALSPVSHPS